MKRILTTIRDALFYAVCSCGWFMTGVRLKDVIDYKNRDTI